jgi:hypothetical protein
LAYCFLTFKITTPCSWGAFKSTLNFVDANEAVLRLASTKNIIEKNGVEILDVIIFTIKKLILVYYFLLFNFAERFKPN